MVNTQMINTQIETITDARGILYTLTYNPNISGHREWAIQIARQQGFVDKVDNPKVKVIMLPPAQPKQNMEHTERHVRHKKYGFMEPDVPGRQKKYGFMPGDGIIDRQKKYGFMS